MATILYEYPGGDGLCSISPPCVKVDLALRLLDVEFDVVYVRSLKTVARISPTRRLPVLEIDGRRIHDSIRILDELELRFDHAPWLQATETERIRDRLWETHVNGHLYWCGFYLRWVHPETSERFFDALFGGAGAPTRWLMRRFFLPRQRQRSRLHGSGCRSRDEIFDEIVRSLDMMVGSLDGGPFLQGRSSPGRGDIALAALLSQVGYRDTLPEVCRLVRERPAAARHLRDVFAACGAEEPRWLAREPSPDSSVRG